jgi:hypothetical protein
MMMDQNQKNRETGLPTRVSSKQKARREAGLFIKQLVDR